MSYEELLDQTRNKYKEERDPAKRKNLLALGKALKSKIEYEKRQTELIQKELL